MCLGYPVYQQKKVDKKAVLRRSAAAVSIVALGCDDNVAADVYRPAHTNASRAVRWTPAQYGFTVVEV